MPDAMQQVYGAIEDELEGSSAATRRKFVAGAAATAGSLGLLALPERVFAANTPQNILNIAATAEVLATIVNTVGAEEVDLDRDTERNVLDAAFQELIHFRVLKSVGAREATRRIWVPDAVFASPENLLNTLVTGDAIFVNAYLIGVTTFAQCGQATFARYSAEIMGVESVHRALALDSLGKKPNDLAFTRYRFTRIETAVKRLQSAGFGFGAKGKGPGRFYDFDSVSRRTKRRKLQSGSLRPS